MMESSGTAGFESRLAPVASSRLTSAIAASLSLCLVVTLTVLSIKLAMATPIPV